VRAASIPVLRQWLAAEGGFAGGVPLPDAFHHSGWKRRIYTLVDQTAGRLLNSVSDGDTLFAHIQELMALHLDPPEDAFNQTMYALMRQEEDRLTAFHARHAAHEAAKAAAVKQAEQAAAEATAAVDATSSSSVRRQGKFGVVRPRRPSKAAIEEIDAALAAAAAAAAAAEAAAADLDQDLDLDLDGPDAEMMLQGKVAPEVQSLLAQEAAAFASAAAASTSSPAAKPVIPSSGADSPSASSPPSAPLYAPRYASKVAWMLLVMCDMGMRPLRDILEWTMAYLSSSPRLADHFYLHSLRQRMETQFLPLSKSVCLSWITAEVAKKDLLAATLARPLATLRPPAAFASQAAVQRSVEHDSIASLSAGDGVEDDDVLGATRALEAEEAAEAAEVASLARAARRKSMMWEEADELEEREIQRQLQLRDGNEAWAHMQQSKRRYGDYNEEQVILHSASFTPSSMAAPSTVTGQLLQQQHASVPLPSFMRPLHNGGGTAGGFEYMRPASGVDSAVALHREQWDWVLRNSGLIPSDTPAPQQPSAAELARLHGGPQLTPIYPPLSPALANLSFASAKRADAAAAAAAGRPHGLSGGAASVLGHLFGASEETVFRRWLGANLSLDMENGVLGVLDSLRRAGHTPDLECFAKALEAVVQVCEGGPKSFLRRTVEEQQEQQRHRGTAADGTAASADSLVELVEQAAVAGASTAAAGSGPPRALHYARLLLADMRSARVVPDISFINSLLYVLLCNGEHRMLQELLSPTGGAAGGQIGVTLIGGGKRRVRDPPAATAAGANAVTSKSPMPASSSKASVAAGAGSAESESESEWRVGYPPTLEEEVAWLESTLVSLRTDPPRFEVKGMGECSRALERLQSAAAQVASSSAAMRGKLYSVSSNNSNNVASSSATGPPPPFFLRADDVTLSVLEAGQSSMEYSPSMLRFLARLRERQELLKELQLVEQEWNDVLRQEHLDAGLPDNTFVARTSWPQKVAAEPTPPENTKPTEGHAEQPRRHKNSKRNGHSQAQRTPRQHQQNA
jgi:hypothetical protein